MIEVREIADRLNEQAPTLAPELLPNGHKSGNKWMFSGIPDHGQSASAYVYLSGSKIGRWTDMGNAAPGEERGDMIDLLRLKLGLDVAGAVAEAKRRLGIQDDFTPARKPDRAEMEKRAAASRQRAEERQQKEAAERAAKAKRARGAWLAGEPIAGTPAQFYLQARGLHRGEYADWPGSLRYHAEMWCTPERCKVPTMLGAIYRADGTQIGTHRTFLQRTDDRGWTKIDSGNAKMVLGNMWGGFIPISKGASGKPMSAMPVDEPVYVTEGIEDAIVVRMALPAARIVSAISLGNMGAIVLPEQARRMVIVCDRDENGHAQDQLARSIAQQQARGVDVQLVIPPNGVKDLNDWLQALARDQGRAA